MSTVDEYFKKINKDTAANVQSQVDIVNNSAAKSSQIVKDDYNAQIKEAEQSYNELFDQNSVQRIINERTIAENMANMGLTDSGLNRTQQTANQLSFANNQSKISRQQQSAVNTLARAMNSKLAEIETNRATQETSIRTKAFNNNYAQAVSMYNSEQKAIANSIAAAQKQQQDDYDKVMAALGNKNYTDAFKQQYVNNYKIKYKLTDDEAQTLFGSPGTKFTYSDSEIEGNAISGDVSLGDDDITNILEIYHKNNENKGVLYDLIESYNIDPNSTQGIALKNEIEKRTEGTRLFWTNPHIDGPLASYYVKDEKLGNASDGIYYASTIKDWKHGNVWTLRDVYNASVQALAKNKYEDKWESHIEDSDIVKEAKIQTKKIQNQYFK